MTTNNEGDVSGSDVEVYEMPETVLCMDTICNICYAEFLDGEDLKVHFRQMHLTEQSRSRYCQFCSTMFPSLEEYARHICDVHILNLKCCKYCMRTFSHLPDVRRHERKHLSASKSGYSCSNCNRVFNNVTDLEDHEYSVHGDGEEGVLLHKCYSLLSSFLNMKASTFLQSLGTHYVYTCASCKISTQDVEYYMQHLQQKNCQSLVCDKCCNVYRKQTGLIRHFTNNSDCHNKVHEDLELPCEKCNNTFNFDFLREHSKICQAVKCVSCDIVFKNVSERASHQAKAHQTMFSIKICKYCHREFVGQVSLNKHIERSHKRDLHLYKYTCISCKDIFNHPKKLFSHFFSKHKDLKPFTCKICSKMFKLRKHFTLHIKLEHSSRGTVMFDDNFHVLFTDEVQTKDKEIVNDENLKQGNTSLNSSGLLNEDDPSIVPIKESVSVLGDVELVMCPTETEVDQTDVDKSKTVERVKKKRRVKAKTPPECVDLTVALLDGTDGDSDNEPLIRVRRRIRTRQLEDFCIPTWLEKSKGMKRNRRKFTCKICQKYCYTYQNYNHHMSLHQRHEYKKCIKCPKVFKSKNKLNNHILNEHSSSKLTETLKSVLERRKHSRHQIEPPKASELSKKVMTDRFLKTIKKVNIEPDDVSVKVTPVIDKLSVKKFIENFTPEAESSGKRKCIQLNNVVTIKQVDQPFRPPAIKLVKFTDTETEFVKLRQPQRYKDRNTEQYEVRIQMVNSNQPPKMNFDQREEEPMNHDYEEVEDAYDSNGPVIPDVAEEVMLEEEEAPKPKEIVHQLIIPKLPEEYKDIHIAHLLPEAPFYKIVKIDEVLKEQTVQKQKEAGDIKLPDGTKLVSVNPLAHLLGDRQVELPKNKYYKPKQVDFEKALAKALWRSNRSSDRRSRETRVQTEQ